MLTFETIKNIARIPALLAILAALLVWAGPFAINALFDFQATRDEVRRIVFEKTGRELHLDGEIYFQLRTLRPGLRLTKVRFQNAAWGTRPDMLRLDSLHIEIGLVPLLLRRELDILSAELVGGELLLETNRAGQGNWELQPAKQEHRDSASSPTSSDQTSQAKPESESESETSAKPGDREQHAWTWLVEDLALRRSELTYVDGDSGRVRQLNIQSADLSLSEKQIVGEVGLRYGRSDLSGRIEYRRHPHVYAAATLHSAMFDIDDFIERETRIRRKARQLRGERQPQHEALPFADLDSINADIDWKIDQIKRATWRPKIVVIKGKLRDGHLDLGPLTGTFVGGSFNADIKASASKNGSVALRLDAQNIDLKQILTDAKERPLADAKLKTRARLQTSGSTLPALRANLAGSIAFEAGAVTIDQPVLFASVGSEAAKAIRTWADPLPQVDCAIARLDFRAGVGKTKVAVLDADELAVVSAGNVNLANESLDLVFTLHAKRLSVFSLASAIPVHLRGPLAHPRASVTTADIAKKIFLSVLELPALPVEYFKSVYDTGLHPAKSLCPAARAKAMAGLD
ncbi:MAG: AsmA family protein [bacterium]|nr:AsmA family protein [bacterium]